VATVTRDPWASMDIFFNKQEYGVLVAPGGKSRCRLCPQGMLLTQISVDLSLIAGLCVALDDLGNRQKASALAASAA
jgi:uncharacterized metal-binding protein